MFAKILSFFSLFFYNFTKNKIKSFECPKSKPATHCFFLIYENTTWTIRRLINERIDPATQHIILKIVEFVDWLQFFHFVFPGFGTLNYFLAGLGSNQVTSACCFAQTVHKPVKQRRKQALRAYCPNVYTVGSVLTICYFLQYLLSHKIVNFLGSESCA